MAKFGEAFLLVSALPSSCKDATAMRDHLLMNELILGPCKVAKSIALFHSGRI